MVIIDNFVPTYNNRLIFGRCNGKETWVIMLEKAWAKLHGSYERTIGGTPENCIRDLTGAPGEIFAFDLYSAKKIWTRVLDADKQNFIITATISKRKNAADAEVLKKLGLLEG